jgi:hypothetical protein
MAQQSGIKEGKWTTEYILPIWDEKGSFWFSVGADDSDTIADIKKRLNQMLLHNAFPELRTQVVESFCWYGIPLPDTLRLSDIKSPLHDLLVSKYGRINVYFQSKHQ